MPKSDTISSNSVKFIRIVIHLFHMTNIDDVDSAILGVLKENARLPTREISKKSGVPLATVNRRMKKLVETGVIKRFTTELDYEKLGTKTIAYVLIRSHPGADYDIIYNKMIKHSSVEDIAATAGQFDIIMKVRVKDNDELSDFLFKYVRNLPSVAQTETLIALNLRK